MSRKICELDFKILQADGTPFKLERADQFPAFAEAWTNTLNRNGGLPILDAARCYHKEIQKSFTATTTSLPTPTCTPAPSVTATPATQQRAPGGAGSGEAGESGGSSSTGSTSASGNATPAGTGSLPPLTPDAFDDPASAVRWQEITSGGDATKNLDALFFDFRCNILSNNLKSNWPTLRRKDAATQPS